MTLRSGCKFELTCTKSGDFAQLVAFVLSIKL